MDRIIVLAVMAIFICGTQSCAPRLITIGFDQNKANVHVGSYYDYSMGIFHKDTIHRAVPIDSIAQYTETCGRETYFFSDSAKTITVRFNEEEEKQSDTCTLLRPQILLEFNDPVAHFSGPTQGLKYTINRKGFLLPSKKKHLPGRYETYRFSTHKNDKPNFTHPFGFKYLGLAIDPLPGYGRGWSSGKAEEVFNDGVFLNFGMALIVNDFRLLMRLAYWDFLDASEIIPDPNFKGMSSANLEFGLGYELVDATFFTVIPKVFGGGKKFKFSPSESEMEMEMIETERFYTYGAGLTVDFKFHQLLRNKVQREAKKGEYFYLKFDTGWYPELFERPFDISGSLVYFTIGFSAYFGGANEIRNLKIKK